MSQELLLEEKLYKALEQTKEKLILFALNKDKNNCYFMFPAGMIVIDEDWLKKPTNIHFLEQKWRVDEIYNEPKESTKSFFIEGSAFFQPLFAVYKKLEFENVDAHESYVCNAQQLNKIFDQVKLFLWSFKDQDLLDSSNPLFVKEMQGFGVMDEKWDKYDVSSKKKAPVDEEIQSTIWHIDGKPIKGTEAFDPFDPMPVTAAENTDSFLPKDGFDISTLDIEDPGNLSNYFGKTETDLKIEEIKSKDEKTSFLGNIKDALNKTKVYFSKVKSIFQKSDAEIVKESSEDKITLDNNVAEEHSEDAASKDPKKSRLSAVFEKGSDLFEGGKTKIRQLKGKTKVYFSKVKSIFQKSDDKVVKESSEAEPEIKKSKVSLDEEIKNFNKKVYIQESGQDEECTWSDEQFMDLVKHQGFTGRTRIMGKDLDAEIAQETEDDEFVETGICEIELIEDEKKSKLSVKKLLYIGGSLVVGVFSFLAGIYDSSISNNSESPSKTKISVTKDINENKGVKDILKDGEEKTIDNKTQTDKEPVYKSNLTQKEIVELKNSAFNYIVGATAPFYTEEKNKELIEEFNERLGKLDESVKYDISAKLAAAYFWKELGKGVSGEELRYVVNEKNINEIFSRYEEMTKSNSSKKELKEIAEKLEINYQK